MSGRLPEPFGIGTFSRIEGTHFPGLVMPHGNVIRLAGFDSVLTILSSWEENLATLKSIARAPEAAEILPLDSLQVHAPVLPRQVFCTVVNYRSHILEGNANGQALIEERQRGIPYVCLKLPTTVIGPNDALSVPAHALKTDWEVELAAVIGLPCRRVSRANAMDFVAGYTLVNDITIRELVARPDMPKLGADWLQSKNSPGFLPTGPFLVPEDFVADPYAIRLQLRLNGELMQDELTSDMILDIATQIEHISRHAQLLPGDLICTGTPAGCGTRFQRFLRPGDVLECSAETFGVQRTTCIAEGD